MKLFLLVYLYATVSLYGQNDSLFDSELIKSNNVQLVEAKFNSYRDNKIDSIFSNETYYEFNENGQLIKEIDKDYDGKSIQMYIVYNYDQKCRKNTKSEVFATEDLINYYSLMKNSYSYNDDCELFKTDFFHLGKWESSEEYNVIYEDNQIVSEEIIIKDFNSIHKKEIQYKYPSKYKVETRIFIDNELEGSYTEELDEHKNITNFCDLFPNETICGKYEYVYENGKIIKESYFVNSAVPDQIIEYEYLENGLMNKKTTYSVDENGKLILLSSTEYNYKTFKELK